MLRVCARRLYQAGLHVPFGTAYPGAKMKHWPRQQLPTNLKLRPEDRLRMSAIPRDVGRIPRDFVLNVLYHNHPCEVEKIWDLCVRDPTVVLDSKRQLRALLRQCRDEGFVSFERAAENDGWVCVLTRERFAEVRDLATAAAQKAVPTNVSVLRGSAMAETTAGMASYESMDLEARERHLAALAAAVEETSATARKFQRAEVDYLPFTDLNGKVGFMWWYDVRDTAGDTRLATGLANTGAQVPAGNIAGIEK